MKTIKTYWHLLKLSLWAIARVFGYYRKHREFVKIITCPYKDKLEHRWWDRTLNLTEINKKFNQYRKRRYSKL